MSALKVAVFVAGVVMVGATLGSAVRSVILPRGIPARLTRRVFLATRLLFEIRMGRRMSYERRDHIMAKYGPMSLLVLLVVWMLSIMSAYAAMYWALGSHVRAAFDLSGSSILTLGFRHTSDLPRTVLVFTEAALGLFLLALLITYLPSLYGAFSKREAMVAMLEVRAGSPPSGVEMIERFRLIEGLGPLTAFWQEWEAWFAELEETHTSFPALSFFRSPQPEHSWVIAAGAVLDGASLVASTLEGPRQSEAELCVRAGFIALRRVAAFFRIPYDPDPRPYDPISVTRAEWDSACERLELAGAHLKVDRDAAWQAFAGWRVNYDAVLLKLCTLTMAPPAPWSSDRAPVKPALFRRRKD